MRKRKMKNQAHQHRMEQLHAMLLEMIQGNLMYEMKVASKKDPLSGISALLNMLNEELRAFVQRDAFQNTQSPFIPVAIGSIILNATHHIEQVTTQIPSLLHYPSEVFVGTNLQDLLLPESLPLYQQTMEALKSTPQDILICPLEFRTGNGLHLKLSGSLQWLTTPAQRPLLVITFMEVVRKDSVLLPRDPFTFANNSSIPAEDRKKLEAAATYLKAHVEDHMISLTELARLVRTNEFKLKRYFKQMYHTTVHEYQKQLRLRRAALYLTDTNLSMKQIAKKLGYKTAPHFSKVFKEHYQMPPSVYRKEKRPPFN